MVPLKIKHIEKEYLIAYLESVRDEINNRFPSFYALISNAGLQPELIVKEKCPDSNQHNL